MIDNLTDYEILEAEIIEPEQQGTTGVELSVVVNIGSIVENFDAYKQAVLALIEPYKDSDLSTLSISEAKNARAFLNSKSKFINEQRLAHERLFMEPFMGYKAKANELKKMIDTEAERLGEIIKKAEEWGRNDRRQLFEKYYVSNYPLLAEVVPFSQILNEKWLNKTHTSNPEREIDDIAEKAASDWASLKKLNLSNYDQAEAVFFRTLDLGKAIAENDRLVADLERIAKMKQQIAERQKEAETTAQDAPESSVVPNRIQQTPVRAENAAQGTVVPPKAWYSIRVDTKDIFCTIDEARDIARRVDALGFDVYLRRKEES